MATVGGPFRKWPRGAGHHRGQLTSAARYPVPSARTPEEQRRIRRRPVSPDRTAWWEKTATPRSGWLQANRTSSGVRTQQDTPRASQHVTADRPLDRREPTSQATKSPASRGGVDKAGVSAQVPL